MMRKLTLVPFIALALAITSSAQAGRGEGRGHRGGMMKMLEKLDLSKEQKEQLAKLKDSDEGKMKETRKKMRESHDKLEQAFKNDASESELRSLRNEVKSARNQMGDLRFEKILAVRKVLTKEQRQKFQAMKEKHRGKHKHWDREEEE